MYKNLLVTTNCRKEWLGHSLIPLIKILLIFAMSWKNRKNSQKRRQIKNLKISMADLLSKKLCHSSPKIQLSIQSLKIS
jgi:hypothetical protein